MTTYNKDADSAIGELRLTEKLEATSLHLDYRSKLSICQHNRLRTLLQLRLRQLEHDRQIALARITHAKRQFQQRYGCKPDHSTILPRVRRDTNCLDNAHIDDQPEDDSDECSKCSCDCCRYGLWRDNSKPANVLRDVEMTMTARFSRVFTVSPVDKSRASGVNVCTMSR